MSETAEKDALSVMAGTSEGSAVAGGEDWKSKYEALERKYQTEKVESGRLSKTNEELAAARKRIAELEGIDRTKRAMADIPEEISGDVPDYYKATSAIIAQRTVDESMAAMNERMERMEMQANEGAKNAFANRINSEFPGFLNGIGPGGDKQAAWDKYLKHNSASVREAMARGDYDTLTYHIREFYQRELGVPVPTGKGVSTVPDPSQTSGGGKPVVTASFIPGKIYTQAEYSALEQRAEEARSRRNFTEYQAMTQELDRIIAEGRING